MKIKMIETMLETIGELDEKEQLKVYKAIVQKILDEDRETSKKRAEARKTKKATETKTTTEIKEKKEKKQPDPEVTECMEMVKNYNGGMVEGAEGQQRKYAKLLIDKIKKIESIQTGKTTWQEVLNLILSIISNNKYHSSKIASPEKIYYNITTLMQVCKQEGKTQQQNNQVLTEV